MSEDTTTDAPVDEGGEQPQPENTDQAEAVKETEEQNTNTAEDISNASEDDVEKWAESKGLDLKNPEDVKKALSSYREAEKKLHQQGQESSQLKELIKEGSIDADASEIDQMRQQLQVLQANQAVNDFYASNPDARGYDAKMAQLVQENPSLAQGGIEALYAVAKLRDMESSKDELKREGGKQALQNLAQKQRAAAPAPSATQYQTSGQITREEVARRTADHDIKWLREHEQDINALL